MVFNIRYLVISLVAHLIFFSLFYFIFYNTYLNKLQNLSVVSKGSAVSMNIVSNELFNTKKNIIKNKKQVFVYPKNTKSEINQTDENQVLEKIRSHTSDGSGGTGNTLSETIPVVNNDDIINCTPPSYPSRSLALGEEGVVVVRLLVDTNGNIVNCKLQKTSGFKSLDNSVMQSLKLWVVKRVPAQKTWVEVSVDFFIR